MPQQVIKMPLSYFWDEKENGNISLTSISQKVDDASKMLTGDTVIELDNGVRCTTRDELFFAVSQSSTKQSREQSESTSSSNAIMDSEKKDSTNGGKIGIVIVLSLIVAFILWVIINQNWTRYCYDDSFTGPVAVNGLPDGWGLPVFIGVFAICMVIGLFLVRRRNNTQ